MICKPATGTGTEIQVSLAFSECSCLRAAELYSLLLSLAQIIVIIFCNYLCKVK